MITKLSIENFKGIRERVELELRPITLLFGANSAGKSSILHALHYAAEIFERRNLDADQTVTGGEFVDLGGFAGLVHGHDLDRAVWIRFDMSDENELCDDTLSYHDMDAINEYLRIPELLDYDANAIAGNPNVSVEIGIQWSELRGGPYVSTYRLYFRPDRDKANRPRKESIEKRSDLFAEITSSPAGDKVFVSHLNLQHPSWLAISAWDCREPTDEEGEDRYLPPISELFDDPEESVFLTSLQYCRECFGAITTTAPNQEDLAPIFLLEGQDSALPSPGKPFKLALRDRDEIFSVSSEEDKEEEDRVYAVAKELAKELSCLLTAPLDLVSGYVKQFRYLGPIREVPPRDFKPIKSTDTTSASGRARWASGLGAWEALSTNTDLIEETNLWLSERLNAGYSVEVKNFKELDLSDPLVVQLITGRAFDEAEESRVKIEQLTAGTRLVLIPSESEIELEPIDVGIGISQVVPVIVTAVIGEGGIQMIEQPELHLHPRLQAELGDLFIDAIQPPPHVQNNFNELGHYWEAKRQYFLLETHSEHLILRLLRRIREKADDELPDGHPGITPEQLAVIYLQQENGSTTAKRLQIDHSGEFVDRWPSGFFAERAKELF